MKFAPVGRMTLAEIEAELKSLGDEWDEFATSDDEGHGGSPGEWMIERMGALEQEQKRRAATQKGTKHGRRHH